MKFWHIFFSNINYMFTLFSICLPFEAKRADWPCDLGIGDKSTLKVILQNQAAVSKNFDVI